MDSFKIDLKDLKEGETDLTFHLDDAFFASLDDAEVRRGRLACTLAVRRTGRLFDLRFHTEGTVTIPCDLCLDDMEQPVAADSELACRLGAEAGEDDGVVTIAEDDGTLDVAWFIYETVALGIPMRHVHAPGQCNPAMARILAEHTADQGGGASGMADSRWAALANLKN